jgi:hypothetical protein
LIDDNTKQHFLAAATLKLREKIASFFAALREARVSPTPQLELVRVFAKNRNQMQVVPFSR